MTTIFKGSEHHDDDENVRVFTCGCQEVFDNYVEDSNSDSDA